MCASCWQGGICTPVIIIIKLSLARDINDRIRPFLALLHFLHLKKNCIRNHYAEFEIYKTFLISFNFSYCTYNMQDSTREAYYCYALLMVEDVLFFIKYWMLFMCSCVANKLEHINFKSMYYNHKIK